MALLATGVWVTAGVVILGIGLVIFALGYVKARPNQAYIITSPQKTSRVVTGKATWRMPFISRVDVIPLDIIQVDIKTTSAVPTNEFIDIFVDGVANIKVRHDVGDIKRAAEIFLMMGRDQVKKIAEEILEGNMREIIGQMKLTELVQNRDKFADEVRTTAMQDMEKMGLEIINITIQNFTDNNGVIQDLGVDNVEQIRKDASIAKAEAQRDVEVKTSEAKEVANQARIKAELLIAEQNTELDLKKAALKRKAQTEQATADAAYSIRQQEEQLKINVAEQNALIARKEKEIELKEREVRVQERFLEASIKKQADADKYAAEQKAQADLFTRTKDAEAELAEETNRAAAIKVVADAEREAALARAKGIEAVGLAEAAAIEKKALAMKKMEEAAILGLVLDSDVLPKIVEAAAAPLAQTDKIVMYGEGNAAKLSKDIMKTGTNILEGVKETLGIDLGGLLSGALGGVAAHKLADKTDEPTVKETPKTEPKPASKPAPEPKPTKKA
ncbi:flotillin family protein [Candidatus Xianfuyuplasma coldseepsis]|uniref:Flotillin family protein n=1 Tax=Candidatus Xianfuyuplasma coldseepsis TaxID=2782163 RepID=A0A7L7KQ92_9MOLU|nr:flotillin family protein [Xianfuyuplasma coldseepsis]QMS84857.1 flotillin family protein [Xianfuyuplasma coldseepsis]